MPSSRSCPLQYSVKAAVSWAAQPVVDRAIPALALPPNGGRLAMPVSRFIALSDRQGSWSIDCILAKRKSSAPAALVTICGPHAVGSQPEADLIVPCVLQCAGWAVGPGSFRCSAVAEGEGCSGEGLAREHCQARCRDSAPAQSCEKS